MRINRLFILWLLFSTSSSFAMSRDIALTMDDLPFVGEKQSFHLNLIIDCLQKNHIPVTGFIIGNQVQEKHWPVLKRFRDIGLSLGNHTWSHANLNHVKAQAYIEEIDHADIFLEDILTTPKYFRYPYLAMGTGEKKEAILKFLLSKNYRIAPITIDSKDFIFNQQLLAVPENERWAFLDELKPVYLDYIWLQTLKAEEKDQAHHRANHPQILLIHANLLNTYALQDIITLYKKHGYHFISLENALKQNNTLKKSRVVVAHSPKPLEAEEAIASYFLTDVSF